MRWLLIFLLLSLTLFSCGSPIQTFRYRGTVAAGGEAGWTFDEPSTSGPDAPLADVTIRMFALGDRVAALKSDARGRFDTFEVDIRDGVRVPIRLTFAKAGYQTLEYSTDSESSTEPLRAEKQMNVVLQPE